MNQQAGHGSAAPATTAALHGGVATDATTYSPTFLLKHFIDVNVEQT